MTDAWGLDRRDSFEYHIWLSKQYRLLAEVLEALEQSGSPLVGKAARGWTPSKACLSAAQSVKARAAAFRRVTQKVQDHADVSHLPPAQFIKMEASVNIIDAQLAAWCRCLKISLAHLDNFSAESLDLILRTIHPRSALFILHEIVLLLASQGAKQTQKEAASTISWTVIRVFQSRRQMPFISEFKLRMISLASKATTDATRYRLAWHLWGADGLGSEEQLLIEKTIAQVSRLDLYRR